MAADIRVAATSNTSHRSQLTEQSGTSPGEVYRSRVWEDLRELFQQEHLTDVMLAAEGQSIHCHKVLLAAASKFFHDKFITNPEKLEHNILDIEDIDFDTLTSVVAYIYSGNIELTVEKTKKLIPASVSLMLPELTNECKHFLEEIIITDTSLCIAVYRIAKANCLEDTAEKVWQVMLNNFGEVTATTAFKEMSQTEVEKYIKSEDLNVASEDPVFEAVVTWVKHDMQKRQERFETLLECISLSHCSLGFLRDAVLHEPLMESGKCFQRVAEALGTQASSQILHLGTSRQTQNRDALVAIFTDQLWVLIDGESKWLNSSLVSGIDMSESIACKTGDGILITGGDPYRNLDRQCWKLSLPTLACTAMPDLNVERCHHASVCEREHVYVLGGSPSFEESASVEYLDEKTGSWCVTTDMPKALNGHTVVNHKHHIYVFGGKDRWFRISEEVLVLDTVTKTWSKQTNMPEAHVAPTSVVYRDRIYVLGGEKKCCMSYNPEKNQWQSHSRPRVHHSANSAVVWQDRVLLCGGDNTTAIEEYNPDTDTWTDWKHSLPETYCRGVFSVRL